MIDTATVAPPGVPVLLTDGKIQAGGRTVVLAHGAGAPMDSPFMAILAEGLAAAGHRVVRFEFPYMARRRADGRKRPPDPASILIDTWWRVIREVGEPAELVLGGKSMGGRMASMVTVELAAQGVPPAGLICLGYPFHPTGRPERLRVDHLSGLRTPTLILQGTRDTLGGREEVAGYDLSPAIEVHWLEDGDHSFKPRKASGRTEAQNLVEAVAAADRFLRALP